MKPIAVPCEGTNGLTHDARGLERAVFADRDQLRRAAVRLVGDMDADDLVQESFVRFLRRDPNRGPVERPRSFLARVMLNLARHPDAVRKRARHVNAVEFIETEHAGVDPLLCLEARDMLSRIEVMVAKLNPRTRDIFIAHRVQGLSYAEIAEQQGMSIKGVEKQMSKAIAALDRLLQC